MQALGIKDPQYRLFHSLQTPRTGELSLKKPSTLASLNTKDSWVKDTDSQGIMVVPVNFWQKNKSV